MNTLIIVMLDLTLMVIGVTLIIDINSKHVLLRLLLTVIGLILIRFVPMFIGK